MNAIKLFLLAPVALLLLMFPVVAHASTQSDLDAACAKATATGGTRPTYCIDSANASDPLTGKDGVLIKVTNIVAFITGVVAVFIIIIAGGRFVLSRGDSAKVVTARQAIIYAIVGLIVILVARTVIIFVLTKI